MELSASILIGKSKRMGRDKALLMLGHQTFIGHLIQELSVCPEVFIASSVDNDYSGYGLKVIKDENRDVGPLEGIRMSLLSAVHDRVFICAYDLPFFTREVLFYLNRFMAPDEDVCVFQDNERVHPLCGIYSRQILPSVEKFIAEGRYRLMDLLREVRTKYISFQDSGLPEDTLCNINTPEEYRALCKKLGINPDRQEDT